MAVRWKGCPREVGGAGCEAPALLVSTPLSTHCHVFNLETLETCLLGVLWRLHYRLSHWWLALGCSWFSLQFLTLPWRGDGWDGLGRARPGQKAPSPWLLGGVPRPNQPSPWSKSCFINIPKDLYHSHHLENPRVLGGALCQTWGQNLNIYLFLQFIASEGLMCFSSKWSGILHWGSSILSLF